MWEQLAIRRDRQRAAGSESFTGNDARDHESGADRWLSRSPGAGGRRASPGARVPAAAHGGGVYELTPGDHQWIESRLNELKSRGDTVDHFHVFVRARATLYLNDEPLARPVYIHRSDPTRFLLRSERILVEFDRKRVATLEGTESLHSPSSGAFVVLVSPLPGPSHGVPIAGGAENPQFSEKEVKWH